MSEESIRTAALRLYMAGRWTCDRPVAEAALWEGLRDALGLKPGTFTTAEKTPGATIVDGALAAPVWGCGHDCRTPDCSGCKVVGYRVLDTEPAPPMPMHAFWLGGDAE